MKINDGQFKTSLKAITDHFCECHPWCTVLGKEQKTVWTYLAAGDLRSESRTGPSDPWKIHINSFYPIDPNCDLYSVPEIAAACGITPRTFFRLKDHPDPEKRPPYDKLGGAITPAQAKDAFVCLTFPMHVYIRKK